ncbi:DUF5763 domain-containing protein [Chitinophaga pinensis]|uniref:Uncharacterized protein n=1 Tax=Chitinophaga pinensis TaxID=79329 RepID=A0A5C6LJA6_9BACT|nr:DUF5763 domain-containing protein [Chitinophaga pinensis]TWV92756.1 hypothetical protein FEF09_28075 [Chitinophaga pinensis]
MKPHPQKRSCLSSVVKAGIVLLLVYILLLLMPGLYSQSVYKTPYGKKYHTADCRMVKNVSQRLSLTEARRMHLDPCRICHPEVQESLIPPVQQLLQQPIEQTSEKNQKKPAGTGNTVRCQGITKKGTRCKHMTSIGNGYCFQHQPD